MLVLPSDHILQHFSVQILAGMKVLPPHLDSAPVEKKFFIDLLHMRTKFTKFTPGFQ